MDLVEVLPRLHMFRFPIGQAYLWRDGPDLTLIDAGGSDAASAIEDGVHGLGLDPGRISRIVVTHGHRDHYGAAQELADRHGAEILAHRLDAAVIRGEEEIADPVLLDWEIPLWEQTRTVPPAPPTRVDRELADGDELGFGQGARVVHSPGHTPGSIGIHLPHHGVLFTGDCVAAVGRVMLGVFNIDREQALASFRRLAALEPATVCFGHGDPVTSGAAAAMLASADRDSRLQVEHG
ncbi:MBL fold metallo-hydrolase [Streptomyces sp. JV185]|uniref:MBL fold metallo-hydrolase n=1 Tax=Streptomyces sp. JV185 TaxID=858638 RepID=UPI002E77D240|nr:MBL fold metallo-hydrolase [Streptomyces sp. JV185]MEE1767279.1 MBL fold metallo-hydrolase [Streptomyces sp. JV185]